MSSNARHNVLIESAAGEVIVIQLEGRQLVGVSDRVALAQLISSCPTLPASPQAIPADKANLLRFFGKGPCYFEGCEELRAEYEAAVAATITASCPPCKKSAIMRKFLPRVEAALKAESPEEPEIQDV